MFDIGFWELSVIAVVALIVVGPEELPSLIRNVTAGVRKVRRTVNAIRTDLDHELRRADELKQLIAEEARLAEMEKLAEDTRASVPLNKTIGVTPDSEKDHETKGTGAGKDTQEQVDTRPHHVKDETS
jgi:sec-independent protein translocase protein TatB